VTSPRSKPVAYLVEQYLPHPTANETQPFVAALRSAAAALSDASEPVRLACSLLVGADELCFHVL
jgi:hypothetical protein